MVDENLDITPVASTPEPQAQLETPTSNDGDKNLGDIYDRLMADDARDDVGRFKAKETLVKAEGGVDPDQPKPEAVKDQPLNSERQVQPATLPANWPKELGDAWASIPEANRAPVQQVLQNLHVKMSDQGRQLSAYREIDPIVADMTTNYAQLFQGDNATTPAAAIGYLYGMQKNMDAGPEKALATWMEVAERYNLIPHLHQRFSQAGQPQPMQQQQMPDVSALLKQIEDRVSARFAPDKIEQQVSSVLTKNQTTEAISRFSAEKPLWAEVEMDIPTYIGIVKSQQPDAAPLALLEAAYDMAIHANPATRAKVSAAAPQATALSNEQRAAAAKKANQLNIKTTQGGRGKPLSEDEALGAAYDRITSAA
jgi:hypothetical protein